VTVATNADALDLNTAVRAIRVAEGSVDDTRTVAGMEGVRIGAGDRIVTRRNDALVGLSNRQSWTVEAVGADGALSAREGDQRVVLEPAYVATAAQLGCATTPNLWGNHRALADMGGRGHQRGRAVCGGDQGPLWEHRARGGRRPRRRPGRDRGRPGP